MPQTAHDILTARAAPYDIVTSRTEDFSETFDIAFTDLSGANIKAVVSDVPGGAPLLTLVDSHGWWTASYQSWIDDCLITADDIPCGKTASDMMTVSTVELSSAQTSIATLPRAETLGEPAIFHWALHQITPEIDLLATGTFTVLETSL